MFIEQLKRALLSLWLHTFVTNVAGVFLLVVVPLLSSCATTAPIQLVPIDLGIPTQALKSPTYGGVCRQLYGSYVFGSDYVSCC